MIVVAAVNWTVVLTAAATGLTAALVAAFSFLGNRSLAAVQRRQVEAATERTREDRKEQHLQHREGVYHDLLNADRRALIMFAQLPASEEFLAVAAALHDHLNGAILFGTGDVANATVRLAEVLSDSVAATAEGGPSPEVLDRLSTRWTLARRDLMDAMRRDIAPDAVAIEEWQWYVELEEEQKSPPAEPTE